MKKPVVALLTTLAVSSLTACSLLPSNTNHFPAPVPTAVAGGTVGAASGAAIGAATGAAAGGNVVTGAAVGTGVGAIAGAAIGHTVDSNGQLAAKLRKAGYTVYQQGDQMHFIITTDQLFLPGTTVIKYSEYKNLNMIAVILNRLDDAPVDVSAYSGNHGTKQWQNQHTFDEAHRVQAYLWSQGVAFSRLKAVGYGSLHPVADNSTPQGVHLNNRIEIASVQRPHFNDALPIYYY